MCIDVSKLETRQNYRAVSACINNVMGCVTLRINIIYTTLGEEYDIMCVLGVDNYLENQSMYSMYMDRCGLVGGSAEYIFNCLGGNVTCLTG